MQILPGLPQGVVVYVVLRVGSLLLVRQNLTLLCPSLVCNSEKVPCLSLPSIGTDSPFLLGLWKCSPPLFTLVVFCCRKLDAQVRAAVAMYSEDWVIVRRRCVRPRAVHGRGRRVAGLQSVVGPSV